ncbi:MAG: DUF4350 domain-containing protein [Gammaproteobacteria bacterium]|nr:DUF4350 domain-containing protein [Gammaproteobacteria bacterium]
MPRELTRLRIRTLFTPWVIALMGLVLLAGVASAWFVRTYELESREEFVGYQGEARVNQWLAARHFLRQMGVDARERHTADVVATEELDHIIVVGPNAYENIDARGLVDWASAGGYLIVVIDAYAPVEFSRAIRAEVVATHSTFPRAVFDEAVLTDSRVGFDTGDLSKRLDCAVRGKIGKGEIVLLCDDAWFRNSRIGEQRNAHAWFKLFSRGSGGQRSTAWFVRNAEYPSVLSLLWRHGRLAVISAMLLVLFGLWKFARRFGSLVPAHAPPRRSVMEHVMGAGWYQWRVGACDVLLTGLRARVLARLPPSARQTPVSSTSLSLIANLTGETEIDCKLALFDAPTKHRGRFTKQVQLLTRMDRIK